MTSTPRTTNTGQPVAVDRAEHEPCEAGTPGCCVDHIHDTTRGGCDSW